MKKFVFFIGIFMLVLGIACATEEVMGCFMLPLSGILYFWGSTSHKAFAFLTFELGKYMIMFGIFIVISVLIFFLPEKREQYVNEIKSFKWKQFGIWKKRRTFFQLFIYLLIIFHIVMVYTNNASLPSICPRSFADLATVGIFGTSAIFWSIMFLLVFIFGRALCGWLCVYTPVQEQSSNILTALGKKPKNTNRNHYLIYVMTSLFWMGIICNVLLHLNNLSFNPANGLKVANLWVFIGGTITMLPLTMLFTHYFGTRFFCKYLCPIGGLISIYSTLGLLKIGIDYDKCKNCKACTKNCQMGVPIDKYIAKEHYYIIDSTCIACGDCIDSCKFNALSYKFMPFWHTTTLSENHEVSELLMPSHNIQDLAK